MKDQVSKHDQVLLALAMNLQSIAMVQLGKVTSPASGAIERDLDGARGTIDILEMLKFKCRHETPAPVVRLLDQAVMDLQMNYLDELKRDRREDKQQEEVVVGDEDSSAEDDPAGAATAASNSNATEGSFENTTKKRSHQESNQTGASKS